MEITEVDGSQKWSTYGKYPVLVKYTDEKWQNFKPSLVPDEVREILLKQKSLKVYDDDVFICTFPRSGTTFTQETTWLILNDFDFDVAKTQLLVRRSPELEFDEFIQFLLNPNEIIDTFATIMRPRLIKTHLPVHLLPDEIWTVKPKIIHVSRDVKDVVVSNYHLYKPTTNFSSIEEYFEYFVKDIHVFAPYRDHLVNYKNFPDYDRILYLNYEEMVSNIDDVIVKIAKFLNKEVSSKNVELLKEHIKFDSMKKNNFCNGKPVFDGKSKLKGVKPIQTNLIRKGVAGGHTDEMSSEWIEIFDNWMAERIDSNWYRKKA